MGISEFDFWNMTFAELDRALSSKKRLIKTEAREKASFDYILADLIGRSVSRVYSSSNKLPEIAEVYPNLFSNEEITQKKQEKKTELSILRFKQFAESHNKRFEEGSKN